MDLSLFYFHVTNCVHNFVLFAIESNFWNYLDGGKIKTAKIWCSIIWQDIISYIKKEHI